MDELLKRSLEKLQVTSNNLRDTKVFHSSSKYNDESVLEKEKRLKLLKKQRLQVKRNESIQKRSERGLPSVCPPEVPDSDYFAFCEPGKDSDLSRLSNKLDHMQVSGKPQNQSPWNFDSYRGNKSFAPPEVSGTKMNINDRFLSDKMIRAKWRSFISETDTTKQKYSLKSSIFPQLEILNSKELNDDDKKALNVLYTSSYQEAFGGPITSYGNECRKIYPLKTLESLADPIRGLAQENLYYPPTRTWLPNGFNLDKFDSTESRYSYMNQERPYEICSHSTRINQIPGYSGSYGTSDRHIDVNNPYKEYKPLNLVRTETPAKPIPSTSYNIPGYTGYSRGELNLTDTICNSIKANN